jgi:glycosyltransferase involved in cell wall biosynthesis
MSKRIFFDGLNLALRTGTGVATYTKVLAHLTKDMGYENGVLHSTPLGLPKDPLAREIAFFDAPVRTSYPGPLQKMVQAGDYIGGLAGVKPTEVPIAGNVVTAALGGRWVPTDHVYAAPRVFDQCRGYFTLFRRLLEVKLPLKVDLFHFTYPIAMRTNARANIYTIHDVIPLRLPYTTLDWKTYYLRSMREILARADHIVTVSENSRRDIVSLFGVDEKRISNTYQAVNIPDHIVHRSEDEIAAEVSGIFKLDYRGYFLFYGALEPKKNVGRVIEAYLASQSKLPLVIVAGHSWLGDDEVRLLNQIDKDVKDKDKRVRRFDYMPFPMLMTLVQGARAVLFPSLYEGFGLPVLEGMTLGTPVITSNSSSIPEVAGDAALMVDPYKTDQIRQAITAVEADDGLWSDLRDRGLRRAAQFSMETYRDRMRALYESLT